MLAAIQITAWSNGAGHSSYRYLARRLLQLDPRRLGLLIDRKLRHWDLMLAEGVARVEHVDLLVTAYTVLAHIVMACVVMAFGAGVRVRFGDLVVLDITCR